MKVVIRQKNLDCRVPYSESDPDKDVLVNTIRDSKIEVMKYDVEIDRIKAEQKPFKEDLEQAEVELATGKSQLVACEEHIRHDDNIVKIKRLDTGEWLPDRVINPADCEPEAFDKEVEEQ